MTNWQQITPNDAFLYCERAGFKSKEIDPFEMEIKEYYLPNTEIQFKYKIQNSDPMKFYIGPESTEKTFPMMNSKTLYLKQRKILNEYLSPS